MDSLAAKRTESWTGVAIASLVALLVALGLGQAWRMQQKVWLKAELITGGNAEAGRASIAAYGCGGCHTISGVTGASGKVGPPLTGFGARATIAGKLANEPKNLVQWIRSPQSVTPGTDMPDMGVKEHEARDIAAYLYTLH